MSTTPQSTVEATRCLSCAIYVSGCYCVNLLGFWQPFFKTAANNVIANSHVIQSVTLN